MTEINLITMELTEQSVLADQALMEWVVSSRTTYLQVDDVLPTEWWHGYGKLSPFVSNIYMQYFKKLALGTTQTIVLAPIQGWHICGLALGPEWFQNFPSHRLSLRPSIHFTTEIVRQVNSFFGCSGHQESYTTCHNVYRKPTHTGLYLNLHIWKEV